MMQRHHPSLLKALHLMTMDGHINQDAQRKLKQIEHLAQFIDPLLKKDERNVLVDVGAGKAYLGHYLKATRSSIPLALYNIEHREDIVRKSTTLCEDLQIQDFHFIQKRCIDVEQLPESPDIVMALHACDTATDEAIDFGLKHKAKHFVLIPCCQAEVARHLKGPREELFRRPIHRREFGSLLTNVLRALRLEAHGWKVTVTEFTGLEHTLKNELIIASKIQSSNKMAAQKLEETLSLYGLEELKSRFLHL